MAERHKRFHSCNELEDLARLIEEKNSKSTLKNMDGAIRVFREYLSENEITCNGIIDGDIEADDLNKYLGLFYVNARKQDGGSYQKNGLQSLRYGIANYYRLKKNIDIISSPLFIQANGLYTARLSEMKKLGFGGVRHYPQIEEDDLIKIYSSFDLNNPQHLQDKVQFDIMFYMCRRGRENLRKMNKDYFKISKTTSGLEFIYQKHNEMDKNHKIGNDESTTDGIILEQTGYDRCPVKSYKLYLQKLSPGVDFLWQRPRPKVHINDDVWFTNQPVGENILGSLMQRISETRLLSQKYTNHSIRVTAVSLMDDNDFKSRVIMRISGHKSEESIKTYSRRINQKKKCDISRTFSRALGQDIPEEVIASKKQCQLITPTDNATTSTSDSNMSAGDFGNFDLNFIFDEIDVVNNINIPEINDMSSQIDNDGKSLNVNSNNPSTNFDLNFNQQINSPEGYNLQPFITNCVVHINYNIKK